MVEIDAIHLFNRKVREPVCPLSYHALFSQYRVSKTNFRSITVQKFSQELSERLVVEVDSKLFNETN